MKIKVSGTALAAAIGQITKITGSKHVSLKAAGEKLTVAGTEKGRTVIQFVPASVKQKGQFTALPDILVGVCRNRKEVVLEMADEESHVAFSSGRYKSDITIVPFEDITVSEPKGGTSFDLAEAELKVILDICDKAQLTAPYIDGAPPLPLLLRITEKGTHVASLDPYHVTSIRTKQVTMENDLELTLPPGALTAVAQLAEGEKHRIVFSEAVVYAEGASFKMVLPLEQVDGGKFGFKNVISLQDRIKSSEPVASAKVVREELDGILSNIYAVSEAGVPIIFSVEKGTLTVSTNTSYGSASEQLDAECRGSGQFKFQPQMVSEIFGKLFGGVNELDVYFLEKMMYMQLRNGETNGLFVMNRLG